MFGFRTCGLLALACLLAAPAAIAADRHVAILVDTSGSMKSNDRQRYTQQVSQVIADLLEDGDRLTVIRMGAGHCSAGASSALALRLDPGDRAGFKRRLEAHTRFNTGTNYSAAIRTAIEVLGRDHETQRMLLILADSGGLGRCSRVLTEELVELRKGGATLAAVNLGSTAGAFDGNPAFHFTTPARDAGEMVAAVARIYQRFLGAKRVQTGRVGDVVSVEIAPWVEEAFLVVAADGPLDELRQAAGNPPAAGIDLDHRGGGETVGVDRRTRVYRIVRLERPAAGRWSFQAPGLSDPAGWMLLQDSAVSVRWVSKPGLAADVDVPLEIELYDRATGERIADPSAIPDLDVRLEVDGRELTFRDDGRGADRQAGDGVLTAVHRFEGAGSKRIPVRLESDFLDRTVTLEAEVLEIVGSLELAEAPAVELGTVRGRSQAEARLDLNKSDVRGVYQGMVSSDFRLGRTVLEIDAGNGWETLGETPREVRLAESADNSWPIRLRVGACPEAVPPGETFSVTVAAAGAEERLTVPIRVEVRPDPWLKCWWPVLALVLGLVIGAVVIHGFWSPSRFPPRLGLVLSPEEDLAEGFFHPIRAQRGSGSGFYRDARIYVQPDFRLSSRPRGALARLRASGTQVRIQPADGAAVWRQTADEDWEELPEDETPARFGVLYRDALGTLFFELRNG